MLIRYTEYRGMPSLARECLGAGVATGLAMLSLPERVRFLEAMAFPDRSIGDDNDYEKHGEYLELLLTASGDRAVGTFDEKFHPTGYEGSSRAVWAIAMPERIQKAQCLIGTHGGRNNPRLIEEVIVGWYNLDEDSDASMVFSWLLDTLISEPYVSNTEFLKLLHGVIEPMQDQLPRLLDALHQAVNHEQARELRDVANKLWHAIVNSASDDRLSSLQAVIEPLLLAESDMCEVAAEAVRKITEADAALHREVNLIRQIVGTMLPESEERNAWWVSDFGTVRYEGRRAILDFEILSGPYERCGAEFWQEVASIIELRYDSLDVPGALDEVGLLVWTLLEDDKPLELVVA